MREYAKLGPTFWTGETGRALRRRGSKALLVAAYLISSPHSNMLGLYYQPILYMAHETGLGIEGATEGLQACIACGFCSYDEATEMVWVHEMAAWQIADSLSSGDKRCKGIQKDYDALSENPFLGAWFDRYREAFHLSTRRDGPAPKQKGHTKPHRSQEQEPPSVGGAEGPSTRGTRLPKAWCLPKPWGEWAIAEFPHWTPDTVRRIADGFADHWRGKAGKDATKADWLATWRNWCRSDITQRQFPPPRAANGSHHPGGQPPLDELTAGVQRRLGITPDPEVLDA